MQIVLTDEGQAVYEVLKNCTGEWLTDKEIAKVIDASRDRLNQREIAYLRVMIANQMIEYRQMPIGGGIGFRNEYRHVG